MPDNRNVMIFVQSRRNWTDLECEQMNKTFNWVVSFEEYKLFSIFRIDVIKLKARLNWHLTAFVQIIETLNLSTFPYEELLDLEIE